MAKETAQTGGLHEVNISKEDWKRWETEDTDSTREFKRSLREWRSKKWNNPSHYYPPEETHHFQEYDLPISLKARKWWRNIKYGIWKFFIGSRREDHYNYKPLLKNIFILIVIGILISLVYTNLEKLNNITLLFIRLGSSLIIIGAFFFIKYLLRLYKNIRYFFRMQRNWFKWVVTIVVLIVLLFAYQNRTSLFDPITKTYEETDFGKFSPFTFTFDELSSVDSGKTYMDTPSNEWTIKEKVQEVLETKPVSINEIEKVVLKYTNEERKSNGLDELTWDSQLGEIARAHSEDMVKNDFFDHINLRGEDPTDRAKKAGFARTKQLGGGWYSDGIAENIGKMPTGNVVGAGYVSNDAESIAKAQVESWMGSSGHRANILNEQYTHLGVGVAYDGLYYVLTQNFW